MQKQGKHNIQYYRKIRYDVLFKGNKAIEKWLIDNGVNENNYNDYEIRIYYAAPNDSLELWHNNKMISMLTMDYRIIDK